MLPFKEFLLKESGKSAKLAFRYDPVQGDRQTVTPEYLSDKKRLTDQEKLMIRQFWRKWNASRGREAIFETKHRTDRLPGIPASLFYVVQVHHQDPSLHLIVVKFEIFNAKKEPATLFVWVRIFNDYDKYGTYLSALRKNIRNHRPITDINPKLREFV